MNLQAHDYTRLLEWSMLWQCYSEIRAMMGRIMTVLAYYEARRHLLGLVRRTTLGVAILREVVSEYRANTCSSLLCLLYSFL